MKRHKRHARCPICDGADEDVRGDSKRCFGFTSDDGQWVHCTREDLAGDIEAGNDNAYAHRMSGACRCGSTHGEAPTSAPDSIEAIYDYVDERGALLFQVVRKAGKKFLQRKPDGGGGWLWKLGDTRRVPYQLPKLIAADPRRVVYLVEGEKDVERLAVHGELATCNPGGAGKWSAVAETARKVLAGRDVVVIADADDVGIAHAHQVADSLRDAVRSLRLVRCPEPYKDVSDLLGAGGSLTELVELERAPDEWNTLTVVDLAQPLPPVPWVCEPIGLAPGAVSLVAGYGYSRKTMALQSLGLSVAMGRPVWGVWSCRRGVFVHLDYEQGRRLTQERYQRLARGMGGELADVDPKNMRACIMPRAYLDEKDIADRLTRLFEGATFVVVDSLRAAFPHADENSSEIRAHLDIMSRVSERTGAAIAVIHHARKPSQQQAGTATHAIRGSSALFDACQSVYVFEGEKDQPTRVHHQKDRVRGLTLDDFGLVSEDVHGPNGEHRWGLVVRHLDLAQMANSQSLRELSRTAAAKAKAEIQLMAIFQQHDCALALTREEIRGLSHMNTRAFDLAWAALKADGRLVPEGKHPKFVWRLVSDRAA